MTTEHSLPKKNKIVYAFSIVGTDKTELEKIRKSIQNKHPMLLISQIQTEELGEKQS